MAIRYSSCDSRSGWRPVGASHVRLEVVGLAELKSFDLGLQDVDGSGRHNDDRCERGEGLNRHEELGSRGQRHGISRGERRRIGERQVEVIRVFRNPMWLGELRIFHLRKLKVGNEFVAGVPKGRAATINFPKPHAEHKAIGEPHRHCRQDQGASIGDMARQHAVNEGEDRNEIEHIDDCNRGDRHEPNRTWLFRMTIRVPEGQEQNRQRF